MREEDGLRPLAAVAIAILLLSLMDALVKFVAGEFTTWQIVLLRYGLGLAMIAPIFAVTQRKLPQLSTLRSSALRGLASLATAYCFFYALSVIALVKAVALSFSAPLFMIIIARVLLREPITARAAAAIAVGSAGVLVMLWQPLMASGGSGSLIGEAAVLMAGFFYALAIVLTRLHGQRDSANAMVLTQTLCITVYALPFGVAEWRPLSAELALLFALIAALGTIANLMMVWGFSRAPASRLGPLEYTNLIWTSILGYALFAEIPTGYTSAGAALIVGASVLAAKRVARSKVQPADA